jgi:hypothetical protein
MAAEIAQQPEVLAGLLAARDELAEAARRIAAARPRFVVIAARGTSDHAALYVLGRQTYRVTMTIRTRKGIVQGTRSITVAEDRQMASAGFVPGGGLIARCCPLRSKRKSAKPHVDPSITSSSNDCARAATR